MVKWRNGEMAKSTGAGVKSWYLHGPVMTQSLTLAPTPDPRRFRAPDGTLLSPPEGWACLPPGDAGMTRRVKQAGPSWVVVEKRGRKIFSQGLWAPAANIEAARAALVTERSTDAYAKRRGTVARTERIPVAQRAEAAVIAWMRHQTTAYDRMVIPRVKGKRREVRGELAGVSRAILDLHRVDRPHAAAACPLCAALPDVT